MPDGKVLGEVEVAAPDDSGGLRSVTKSIAPAFCRRLNNCRILPRIGNLTSFSMGPLDR